MLNSARREETKPDSVEEPVTRYVAPEKPWMLRLRSTESFKAKLDGVVKLWKAHAEARGDDPKQIDLSYVLRNMLESGVDAAFAEYKGFPEDEKAWEIIRAAIAKSVKSTR